MAQGINYTTLEYCTVQDVSNFLLYQIDTSFVGQVNDWIAAAESEVNRYLGYTTASGVLSEQITKEKIMAHFDTEANLLLFPRKMPIQSISAISLSKGTSVINLTLTDNAGNAKYDIPTGLSYILYPYYEFAVSGTSVIQGFQNLRFRKFFANLTYIAGYSQVPADIRLATMNFVADIIMRHANKEGLERMTQGRVSKQWMFNRAIMDRFSEFKFEAFNLLKPYRLVNQFI